MYGSKFKYFLGGLLFAFSVVWIPSPAPAFADVVCTSSDAEMVGPGFEDVAVDNQKVQIVRSSVRLLLSLMPPRFYRLVRDLMLIVCFMMSLLTAFNMSVCYRLIQSLN